MDFILNELNKLTMATYIVEYDYTAKSFDELTIRKGDIITEAARSEDGWLKGECRGKVGHFPENFVTAINKEKAKNRTFPTNPIENKTDTIRKRPFINNNTPSEDGTLFQVRAVYTYLPVHNDEITIKPNDIINVTRMVEEGWYEGILDGKKGLFPSNYVTRIHDDENNNNKTKTNQPMKLKPVSSLRTLVRNEASKKPHPIKAKVLYDYKATANDELTLIVGDIVTVLDKNLEDEGWWKGELNGRTGVFPDNYVEEITTTTAATNLKHRPNTPEILNKHPPQTSTPSLKNKLTNDDSSHNYSNDSHKPSLNTQEDGHSSRDHYTQHIDSNDSNKHRPMSAKRPPSTSATITKKNENGLTKTSGSLDETNRSQPTSDTNHKVHTPSPPLHQRDPGQLESPRYTSRSFSLTNPTLNGTNETMHSLGIEQLQKDISKLKTTTDEMKSKFSEQIQDLMNELDEEKKARAALQIELERLQKLIQKSSRINT